MTSNRTAHTQNKLRIFFITSHCHDGELELVYELSNREDVASVALVIPFSQLYRTQAMKKLKIHTFHFESSSVKRLIPWNVHSNEFKPGLELYMIAPIVSGIMLPQVDKFISVAKESSANLVISSGLLVLPSAQMVAQKMDAPFLQIQHVPILHSDLFPPVFMNPELAARIIHEFHNGKRYIEKERNGNIVQSLEFLGMHAKSLKIMFQSILDDINIIRRYVELPDLSSRQLSYICGHSADSETIESGFNPHVLLAMPKFMDVDDSARSSNVTRVGLLNSIPSAEVDIQFATFIQQGPPPVLVNMDWNAPEEVRMMVAKETLNGFADAGITRVILMPGIVEKGVRETISYDIYGHAQNSGRINRTVLWGKFVHVYMVDSENEPSLATLLAKSIMVLCHADANTAAISMQFGVPMLCAPITSDQFFRAELLTREKRAQRVCHWALRGFKSADIARCVYGAKHMEIEPLSNDISAVCDKVFEIAHKSQNVKELS